jgi:hypothetical protein
MFNTGGRPSQCLSHISVRGLLSSTLAVLGKRLKLTRNLWVSHVLGSTGQGPRGFQTFFTNHIASTRTQLCMHVGTFTRLQVHKIER